MAKTEKVLDIRVDGCWFVCVFHRGEKVNPYHLYEKTYERNAEHGWYEWHRKQLERYGNFISVVDHLRYIMVQRNIGFKDVF